MAITYYLLRSKEAGLEPEPLENWKGRQTRHRGCGPLPLSEPDGLGYAARIYISA